MTIEYVIVLSIVFAAVAYAGNTLRKKAFPSKKTGCDSDCGCGK